MADYIVYDGVEPNPKDVNVEEGARIAREFGADSIIAIGGGSPIDCAKSVGVLLAHKGDKIKKYEGKTAATKPLPLLITIPTTSGTGSELTFSSVITDTLNNYKMTVKSQYTAAKVAICDPELTLSLPAHITASTGMDALTHAIEAFTATCAEPLKPPIEGINLPGIFTLWTVPDTDNIIKFINEKKPKNALVIGGGFIGLEVAENLVSAGLNVTVAEAMNQVMAPIDYEMAQLVHENMVSNNIELILGDGVSKFESNDGVITITLSSGRTLTADMVILSIDVLQRFFLQILMTYQNQRIANFFIDSFLYGISFDVDFISKKIS